MTYGTTFLKIVVGVKIRSKSKTGHSGHLGCNVASQVQIAYPPEGHMRRKAYHPKATGGVLEGGCPKQDDRAAIGHPFDASVGR